MSEILNRISKDWNYISQLNRKILVAKTNEDKSILREKKKQFENFLEKEHEEKQVEKFIKEINGYDEFA